MPLDAYGVLVGTLASHFRDPPDEQGRWYHVNLLVDAPDGRGVTRSYRAAVDVDSKMSAVGVEWKVLRLTAPALGPVAALGPGWHPLAMAEASGALDYVRHPALRDSPGCVFVRDPGPFLRALLAALRPRWTAGSHLDASAALEGVLVAGATVLVFGEPFTTGLGVHDVHQNQGDPAGSQWWAQNGPWQDGATMVRRPDGAYDAFLSKFSSQAYRTDSAGHPA
ncbi:MAG TPA: DUF2278 family protein [Acidimicrobiales bacterium]